MKKDSEKGWTSFIPNRHLKDHCIVNLYISFVVQTMLQTFLHQIVTEEVFFKDFYRFTVKYTSTVSATGLQFTKDSQHSTVHIY